MKQKKAPSRRQRGRSKQRHTQTSGGSKSRAAQAQRESQSLVESLVVGDEWENTGFVHRVTKFEGGVLETGFHPFTPPIGRSVLSAPYYSTIG